MAETKGSTNFLIFNEENSPDRTYNDDEYKQASQRQGGVTPGMALSRLHNKLYLQCSAFAYAFSQFLVNQGFDAYDNKTDELAANIEKAIRKFNTEDISQEVSTHNKDTSAHENFQGATEEQAGVRGMVPAPGKGSADRFLSADGTFKSPLPPGGSADKVLSGAGTWVDGGINLLKRNKAYAVGDIAYSPKLPSWAYLECTEAGTTGDSEPEALTEVTTSSVGGQ